MGTTVRQDREFITAMLPDNFLETAIDWIADNISPDVVFDDKVLEKWAVENGFTKNETA